MDKFDEMMVRALSAEDRELLARHGEPGYLSQAVGIFRGPWNWVMWLVNAVGGAAFLLSLFAFWQVYEAADPLIAVKWGIASLACLQISVMAKNFLGTHMEANRLMREVKRVELQVSLLRQNA